MANPPPDFLPLAPNGVTVLGDKMLLYVEAEEFFIPSVRVNFKAFFTDSNGQSREITFQENLTAEPSKTRDPNSSKKGLPDRLGREPPGRQGGQAKRLHGYFYRPWQGGVRPPLGGAVPG